MSGLALMEVQRALYVKLQGDGVLMGMVSGIYDTVPQKTPTPYVIIGDGDCVDMAADVSALSELRLKLDIWTESAGRKTALAIMNRLHALLHLGTLTVSGYQLVMLRCEQADTQLSEQANYMQGTMLVHATIAEV